MLAFRENFFQAGELYFAMEASIPEPGQTNWLTTDAENTRIAFTDWVSTVDSHFVKKEGKKLAELTHPETLERARDVVKVLGLNKAVSQTSCAP